MNSSQNWRKISKKGIIKNIFIIVSLILFFVWFYCLVIDNNGLQRRVLFYDTNDWFMDFFNTIYYTVGRSPYSWGALCNRNYFPIVYLLLYPFSFFFNYDTQVWATTYEARNTQLLGICGGVFLTVSFGMLFYGLYKAIGEKENEASKLLILASLFFSAITLSSFDRGNLWTITVALIFIFFLTYKSKNKQYKNIGLFSLVVASVFKIFPAIFGVVLLYEKKWKDAIIAIIGGGVLAIVPFAFLKGGFLYNIKMFIVALVEHGKVYANGTIGFNSKIIINVDNSKWLFIGYLLFLVALFVAKYMNDRDRITLLFLTMIITSGQQGYYCLLLLYLPITMFLLDDWKKTDIFYLIAYILLLQPLQYTYENSYLCINNTTVTNTVLLLLYIILLIKGIVNCFPKVCLKTKYCINWSNYVN